MSFDVIIAQLIKEGFTAYKAGKAKRALALLQPIQAVDHRVDYFLALIYSFTDARDFKKAKQHLESYKKRSAGSQLRVDDRVLAMFLRHIRSQTGTYDEREAIALQEIAKGNESHYLSLAFLYVNEAQHYDFALVLAELGEEYLNGKAETERHSEWGRGGYHIVACVYLWYRLYKRVERLEAYFLDNRYYENHQLNGGFLLIALGMVDNEYLTGLFSRFDLKTRYPYHYQYYYYFVHCPNEPMPRALDVNGRNLMVNVGYMRERYALNTYHYLSTTRWLPNLAELTEQVNHVPAADWKGLFELQPLLKAAADQNILKTSRFEEAVATVRQTLQFTTSILLPFDWQTSYDVHRMIGSPNISYRRYSLVELCMMLTSIYYADMQPTNGFYHTITDVVESGELLKLLIALERKV